MYITKEIAAKLEFEVNAPLKHCASTVSDFSHFYFKVLHGDNEKLNATVFKML